MLTIVMNINAQAETLTASVVPSITMRAITSRRNQLRLRPCDLRPRFARGVFVTGRERECASQLPPRRAQRFCPDPACSGRANSVVWLHTPPRVPVTRGRGPDDAPEVAIELALVVEPDLGRDLGRPDAAPE
jgi:hypothetical protein